MINEVEIIDDKTIRILHQKYIKFDYAELMIRRAYERGKKEGQHIVKHVAQIECIFKDED